MRKFYTYTVAIEIEAVDENDALFTFYNTPLNKLTTSIRNIEIEEIE
jgi:hypothetical protein